ENTQITASGNGFDARSTAGTLTIAVNNATVNSSQTGLFVDGSGGGTATITGFANNSVSQNNGGTGISVNGAAFDATPGGAFQTVAAGTTVVGASGNGVGGSGVVLT